MLTILPGAMFANGWLTLKVLLVVVYVVLGVHALRRGKTPAARALAYALALSTFIVIIGIARMHHPAGWLLPYLA